MILRFAIEVPAKSAQGLYQDGNAHNITLPFCSETLDFPLRAAREVSGPRYSFAALPAFSPFTRAPLFVIGQAREDVRWRTGGLTHAGWVLPWMLVSLPRHLHGNLPSPRGKLRDNESRFC